MTLRFTCQGAVDGREVDSEKAMVTGLEVVTGTAEGRRGTTGQALEVGLETEVGCPAAG